MQKALNAFAMIGVCVQSAAPRDWFSDTFGFYESQMAELKGRRVTYDPINAKLSVSGKQYVVSELETQSLSELRHEVRKSGARRLPAQEIVADAMTLPFHFENSVIQVASGRDCLEIEGKDHMITRYGRILAQGAACALACPAGTLVRRYFTDIDIDLLDDFERSEDDSTIKVGIHWSVQADFKGRVSQEGTAQLIPAKRPSFVTQVFTAALPRSVKNKKVLQAAYESTLLVGAIKAAKRGSVVTVVLTYGLGTGTLGNDPEWANEALFNAVAAVEQLGPNIKVVIAHFSESTRYNQTVTQRLQKARSAIQPKAAEGGGWSLRAVAQSSWFEKLFGFAESADARDHVRFDSGKGYLHVIYPQNGHVLKSFKTWTPSLQELTFPNDSGTVSLDHIATRDVLDLHAQHPGAVFQAASQFNCLEFAILALYLRMV